MLSTKAQSLARLLIHIVYAGNPFYGFLIDHIRWTSSIVARAG
jgi:hypothetical protein